jgi:hypothetical protein
MTILKRMARMATIGVMTEAVKRRSGCDHSFAADRRRRENHPLPRTFVAMVLRHGFITSQ